MKGVFDVKAGSPYNDELAVRYHFPNARYMQAVTACIGDWIVYREPRDSGGSLAYFAAAYVTQIDPDPNDATHSYARIKNYLPFESLVHFHSGGRYEESGLRALAQKSAVGVYLRGRSVRPLSSSDFASIVLKGLARTLSTENARRYQLEQEVLDADTALLLKAEPVEKARRIEQILLNRPIRDARFRGQVLAAYNDTCAVTGIRLINGGGRAEAQAAHIVPVSAGGLDIVQNGIALCATAHWLFDRHLISVGEHGQLLVAHNRVPETLRTSLLPTGRNLYLPKDPSQHPAEKFLLHHRERFASAC